MRAVLGLFLLLVACPLSLRLTAFPAPEITQFRGSEQVIMAHVPYAGFTWQTRYATAVRLESGRIADGVFYSGGWYQVEQLPLNGSGGFPMKIDNYAARLCASNPFSEPVCVICDVTRSDGCG